MNDHEQSHRAGLLAGLREALAICEEPLKLPHPYTIAGEKVEWVNCHWAYVAALKARIEAVEAHEP